MAKLPKSEVDFQHPGMGEERCDECVHYDPTMSATEACNIVEGTIYPYDWCKEFDEN